LRTYSLLQAAFGATAGRATIPAATMVRTGVGGVQTMMVGTLLHTESAATVTVTTTLITCSGHSASVMNQLMILITVTASPADTGLWRSFIGAMEPLLTIE